MSAEFLSDDDLLAEPKPSNELGEIVQFRSPKDRGAITDMLNEQQRQPITFNGQPVRVGMDLQMHKVDPAQQTRPTVGLASKKSEPQYLTDEEIGASPQWTPWSNIKEGVKEFIWGKADGRTPGANEAPASQSFGARAAGEIAPLADMFAGAPAQALKSGPIYKGIRDYLFLTGTPYQEAAKQAQDLANKSMPDAFLTPFRKIMETLGFGNNYTESNVSKVFEYIGEAAQKGSAAASEKTGGLVPPQDFDEALNFGLNAAGVYGMGRGLRRAEQRKGPKVEQKGRTEPGFGPEPAPVEGEFVQGRVPAAVQRRPSQSGTGATYEGQPVTPPTQIAPPQLRLPPPQSAKQFLESVERGTIDPELLKTMGVAGAVVATGGWLYMHPEEAAKVGVPSLLAAGAVRSKGEGVFHPTVVETLARPLLDRLAPPTRQNLDIVTPLVASGAEVEGNWAVRAIRNHLNKHMGTPTDPLIDVPVPMFGDTVTWGNLSDNLLSKDMVQGPRGPEVQWDLNTKDALGRLEEEYNQWRDTEGFPKATMEDLPFEAGKSFTEAHRDTWADFTTRRSDLTAMHHQRALQSYLAHVGDYLREFVPTEKLQQYDLVRAVRETAAQDVKQAAKMLKARVNQAGTTVYKEYPDGMRWVEVGVPGEKGIPEGYSVTPYPNGSFELLKNGKPTKETDKFGDTFRAPNYKTLEDAQAAARRMAADDALRNEGDVMGHCVGGYCELVHNGQSKIYSLRDKQGMSHVTVEVSPPDVRLPENGPEYFARVMGGEYLKRLHEAGLGRTDEIRRFNQEVFADPKYREWLASKPSDVLQIKGKQNRAPVEKYLPYVQDFVKSGKWGEVQELGNAGLYDIQSRATRSTHPDSGAKLLELGEQNFPGQRYLTKEELEPLLDKVFKHRVDPTQAGRIDPKLRDALAAVGLGAAVFGYLAKDDKVAWALAGAVLGGLATTIGGRSRLDALAKGLKDLVLPTDVRLGELHPAIKLKMRDYDMGVLENTHIFMNQAVPFMKSVENLPAAELRELTKAAMMGDRVAVDRIVSQHPGMQQQWQSTRAMLDGFGRALHSYGMIKHMVPDYFPRRVKDYEGLRRALGSNPIRTVLESHIQAAEKKARVRGVPLSAFERDIIINRTLSNFYSQQGHVPGYARSRTIDKITDDLLPFYHSLNESLFINVKEAITDIETAKFFGKDLVQSKGTAGQQYTNVPVSVGNLVGRLMQDGKITPEQVKELEGLLEARFSGGERSPSRNWQEVRNLTNLLLLGNPESAATQFGDVFMPMYKTDILATATALARSVKPGARKVTPREYGLADHIAEEFVTGGTADAVNRVFKMVGFTGVDQLGKSTLLNASVDFWQRQAKSKKGTEYLAEKYLDAYGNYRFRRLLGDLRAGRISRDVRLLAFSELADMQPITRSGTSKLYMEHPNARYAATMKTFAMKQLGVVYEDGYMNIKKGVRENKPLLVARGLKNIAAYGIVLGVGGAASDMLKDLILFRKQDTDMGDVLENVLKTFGASQYVREEAERKGPFRAYLGAMAPPVQILDDATMAMTKGDPKVSRYIPIGGRHIYGLEPPYGMGGNAKREFNESKRDKKAGKPVELSPAAVRYHEHLKQKARDKRQKAREERAQ